MKTQKYPAILRRPAVNPAQEHHLPSCNDLTKSFSQDGRILFPYTRAGKKLIYCFFLARAYKGFLSYHPVYYKKERNNKEIEVGRNFLKQDSRRIVDFFYPVGGII